MPELGDRDRAGAVSWSPARMAKSPSCMPRRRCSNTEAAVILGQIGRMPADRMLLMAGLMLARQGPRRWRTRSRRFRKKIKSQDKDPRLGKRGNALPTARAHRRVAGRGPRTELPDRFTDGLAEHRCPGRGHRRRDRGATRIDASARGREDQSSRTGSRRAASSLGAAARCGPHRRVEARAHGGRHRLWVQQVDAQREFRRLGLQDWISARCAALHHAVGTGETFRPMCRRRTPPAACPTVRSADRRKATTGPARGCCRGSACRDPWPADRRRGQCADVDRGMHPDVGLAPAIMDRAAQMRHRALVGHVHRRQRRLSAAGLDAVVQFLERADGAGTATTCAPRSASHSALAAPIPREAPVTSAICPSKGLSMGRLLPRFVRRRQEAAAVRRA